MYSGDPPERAPCCPIAGSIISLASVTFSITIAALWLASQQYGPRLLRSFVRDRSNQFVLGIFVGTFLYNLVVIRTIRGATRATFVPDVAVTFGVALAIASSSLANFIHHVALSLAPEYIINAVGKELDRVMRLYPQRFRRHVCRSGSSRARARFRKKLENAFGPIR